MALIYLDEDISRDTERILTQSGTTSFMPWTLDIVQCPTRNTSGFAAENGRILVTFNCRDFRQAHQIWVAVSAWTDLLPSHAGILTPLGQVPNTQWAQLVHSFVSLSQDRYGHPNFYNQMWEWRRQQQSWLRFGW